MGERDGRRPLDKPRRGWEDDINMILKKYKWEDVDWIHLARERGKCQAVVNTVMNLRVL
jgi:hypothetical protein